MTKSSRTTTIYRPDDTAYIAVFSGTDRDPEIRLYRSARELMEDASEHLKLEFPCIMRGEPTDTKPVGLMMAISSSEGSTSILCNTAIPYKDIAELFRSIAVCDIVKEY